MLKFRSENERQEEVVTAPIYWPAPTLPEFGPRPVKRSVLAIVLEAFFALSIGITLLAGWQLGTKEVSVLNGLADNGKVSQATVTQKETKRSGKNNKRFLHIEYRVGGKTFEHREKVDRSTFEAHEIGSQMTVTYSERDPSLHRLGVVDQNRVQEKANDFLLGTGAFVIFELIALGAITLGRKKQERLLAEGVATSAQIEKAKVVSNGKTSSLSVEFSYRDASGAIQKGKGSVSTSSKTAYQPGAFHTVLYDPQKPEKAYLKDSLVMVSLDERNW